MAKKAGGKSKRIKKVALTLPKDKTEAARFITELGELDLRADGVISRYQTEMRTIHALAVNDLAPINTRIEELFNGLMAFAAANRGELLPDGKKTVELGTGSMGWRTTPLSVQIVGTEKVLERLKELRLNKFIRIKETIDRAAMLKDREEAESVRGVSFSQNEEFFVKPAKLKVEVTGRKRKIESKKKKGEEEDE